MNRGLAILMLGLLLGVVGYCSTFVLRTKQPRAAAQAEMPELYWLKQEFNLTPEEFARIEQLHQAYLPDCTEMCRRIDKQNRRIRELVSESEEVTAEIRAALVESAQLRARCEERMLQHFYQVSQNMPEEQGERYLRWVKEKTFLPDYGMSTR